ncbi:NAD(P)-dependent oxidoreductase [bacterium]|jgi:3-hydroxyisobutyrate dehydrogenase|nr:NAD(P)-dependent oxidoreductase [bacterium]MDB4589806.1 NAD(P)-dependent oxidoreductase [Verrucomicrobiales bacterium]MDF1788850.1 NAD(P)-dependent oxidoreductase [Verrucomicrobiales bacterium]
MTSNRLPTLGFVGIGVMGRSMAGHLLEAGYPLHIYNRTRSKADALVSQGARWQDSSADVAKASDIVITIIGFPTDVEAAYLGPEGIIANAKPGSILIDMTTSSPKLAQQIAEAASALQLQALDAPVSGGDLGAREARLSIMVGGEESTFDQVKPIFEVMGKNIVYQGPAGSGQHTKMANQVAIASGMLGVCEAVAYAERSGLDANRVLESISSGAAGSWSLSNLAPRIIKGDFNPGFFVKHFIKDMTIALQEADDMGLDFPGLTAAREAYEKLAASGGEDLGTQGLYKLYQASE